MTPIYVRIVSTETTPITVAMFTFGSPIHLISEFDQLPKSGPAVLYIAAHAVPNALRRKDGGLLSEEDLFKELEGRAGLPTLVVFDLCFAKSFSKIPSFPWPANFGLIFSCLEHERTWSRDLDAKSRQSLFSEAFNTEVNLCIAKRDFSDLQSNLVARFDGIQTPFVEASQALLREVFFGAAASSGTTSASSKSAPPKAAE
jgi:hypothetical protein